jgi:hypothetical protein
MTNNTPPNINPHAICAALRHARNSLCHRVELAAGAPDHRKRVPARTARDGIAGSSGLAGTDRGRRIDARRVAPRPTGDRARKYRARTASGHRTARSARPAPPNRRSGAGPGNEHLDLPGVCPGRPRIAAGRTVEPAAAARPFRLAGAPGCGRGFQPRYCPPFTSIVAPVMKPAPSPARKATTRATSSGAPSRPTGIPATMPCKTSGRTAATIAVSQ